MTNNTNTPARPMAQYDTIRQAITAAVAAQNLSLTKAAKQCGISQPVLTRFMAGTRQTIAEETVAKIAGGLGLTLPELPAAPAPVDESALPAETVRALNGGAEPAAGALVYPRLVQIVRSDANPRKDFDPEEIDALAASIATHGLLQNLVVTDTGRTNNLGEPIYELIAGERRHRALWQLAEINMWPRQGATEAEVNAGTVPCRVMPEGFDRAEHIALALVENVQRLDLTPLDEAEAFAELIKLGWSKGRIAERIRKGVRHVELRLQLVNNLTDGAKAALKAGEIDLAKARVLATVTAKDQDRALKEGLTDYTGAPISAEQLRQKVTRAYVPVDRAFREVPAGIKGVLDLPAEDGGDQPRRVFETEAAFKAFQQATVEALTAEYKAAGWAFVDVVGGRWQMRQGRYVMGEHKGGKGGPADRALLVSMDRTAAGVVILHEKYSGNIEVVEGAQHTPDLLDPAEEQEARRAENEARIARMDQERAHRAEVAERMTAAITGNLDFALRLMAYGALANQHWQSDQPTGIVAPEVELPYAVVAALDERIAAALLPLDGDEDPTDVSAQWADNAAGWQLLAELPNQVVLQLLALMVAELSSLPVNNTAGLWHADPILQAQATELGIDLTPGRPLAEVLADAGEAITPELVDQFAASNACSKIGNTPQPGKTAKPASVKPVKWNGALWLCTGAAYLANGAGVEADCYRVVPVAEFAGLTRPGGYASDQRGTVGGYHGITVKHGKDEGVLVGPATRFARDDQGNARIVEIPRDDSDDGDDGEAEDDADVLAAAEAGV